MNRITSQAVRHALALNGNPRTLVNGFLLGIDPYKSDCTSNVVDMLDLAASDVWTRVRFTFEKASDVQALENCWATVAHLPEWTALLFRAARLSGSNEVADRALALAKFSIKKWAATPFVSVIRFTADKSSRTSCPDLLEFEGMNPQLRVRFGLSHRLSKGETWPQLLSAAASVSKLNGQECAGLLEEAGRYLAPKFDKTLKLSDIARLDESSFKLMVGSESLQQHLCPVEIARLRSPKSEIKRLVHLYAQAKSQLTEIARNLSQMSWAKAGRIASRLQPSDVLEFAVDDCQCLFNQIIRSSDEGNHDLQSTWRPMSGSQAEVLNTLFKRKVVNPHWTQSATALRQVLCKSASGEISLSENERSLLSSTWSLQAQRELVRSGKADYLSTSARVWDILPIEIVMKAAAILNAKGDQLLFEQLQREVTAEKTLRALVHLKNKAVSEQVERVTNSISVDRKKRRESLTGRAKDDIFPSPTWSDWVAPEIGKRIWHQAVRIGVVSDATSQQVVFVWRVCPDEEATTDFQHVAGNVLSNSKLASYELAVALADQLKRRPESADYLIPSMSAELATYVSELEREILNCHLLNEIAVRCKPELLYIFWAKQLQRATSAKELEALLLQGIKKDFLIGWSNHWTGITGTARDKARALSLVACRHPRVLQKLKLKLGETNLQAGMFAAAKLLLPYRKSDAIQLELTAALGTRHGPSIQWLLLKRDKAASKGCQLDSLYTTYEIPKKSGSMRTIFAPHSSLKRVQRSILVNILTPLGTHPNVHGFVCGRSIVSNASVHVNKKIVVNADVSNCFPSVRWPLVLTALKRDIGEKYSAPTLSALTDICTAMGALPIGAPTSPALLNRVLLKTDEILSAKADERGCSYSRYADDITFSGDEDAIKMLGIAKGLIARIGLELDPKKTNIFRRGRRQICTGLVVNDKVAVPRRIRRNLRAVLHAIESGKKPTWNGSSVSMSVIRGWLEYLRMVDPESSHPLLIRFKALDLS